MLESSLVEAKLDISIQSIHVNRTSNYFKMLKYELSPQGVFSCEVNILQELYSVYVSRLDRFLIFFF